MLLTHNQGKSLENDCSCPETEAFFRPTPRYLTGNLAKALNHEPIKPLTPAPPLTPKHIRIHLQVPKQARLTRQPTSQNARKRVSCAMACLN